MAETSVVLNKDGSVTAGATNGPIPLNVRGKWSFDGRAFRLVRGEKRRREDQTRQTLGHKRNMTFIRFDNVAQRLERRADALRQFPG